MLLLSGVLASIKPTKEEARSELSFCHSLILRVKKHVPKGCDVVLTGSMAKGTFLKDKKDADIFVLFDRSVPKEDLENRVRSIMEFAFPGLGYQVSYAEHPYVRFHYLGRRVDLVPAYRIAAAEDRLSAVDRSVLHTRFVVRNLKNHSRDQVLLLKQFLKANSLYGAEIKIQGFSGYLCELLIIAYGSFMELVRSAAKWGKYKKKPVFIDLKKYYCGKSKLAKLEREDALKRFGFFVIIDPTDKNRNVAAAVSEHNFKKFVTVCKAFKSKPDAEFFFRVPPSFDDLVASSSKQRNQNNHILVLSMPRPDVVDDTLWGQIHKLVGQLRNQLEHEGFKPKKIFADDSKHLVRICFVLGASVSPSELTTHGPPVSMKVHFSKFKKSHSGAKFKFSVKDGKRHIYAQSRVKPISAESAIMDFMRKYALSSQSHIAYSEEMLVLERVSGWKSKKSVGKRL